MQTVRSTRETSEDQLVSDSRAKLCAGVEAGTTTFEIKSGYGLRPYDELKILRVIRRLQNETSCHIVPTFLGAHAIPPYWKQDDYSRVVIQDMLPAVAKEKLARFCDVFCEDGAFDVGASERILRAGVHRGLETKIHADQFSDNGGAKLSNDVGAVSADHLVHSDLSELERMAETGVVPVILPVSSQSLLSQDYANARKMLDLGLPLALGTDFSPSNWALGLLTVAAVAARQLRMGFEEIIRGITINAARALGLNHRTGSLTPRKDADIVILRAPSYKRIGYAFGEGIVDKVLIAGNQIVDGGKMIL